MKQIGTIVVTTTGVCEIPVYDTDWDWDWEQEDPNEVDMLPIEAKRRGESRYSTDYEFVRSTPENVECPDCQGRGWHTERQGRMSGQFTCLVCGGTGRVTPENAECPVVDENGNHPVEHDGAECWHCGKKPTTENVDSP